MVDPLGSFDGRLPGRGRIAGLAPRFGATTVGIGVVAETALSWDGGERKLDLRGRLGVERVLGDAETVADVSGERLGSEAASTRGVLGLGAAYRWNRWSLGGESFRLRLGFGRHRLRRQPPPRNAVLERDRP